MSRKLRSRNRRTPTIDRLEDRSLLAANAFDAHYAVILLELNRFTLHSDIGDLKRSIDESSDLALQDAATETRGIYNDFFQIKAQELYDSTVNNRAAVRADRALANQFKQYYNRIHGIERQIVSIRRRFDDQLNNQDRQVDRLVNQAEGAVNNGADPGTVVNRNNVQIGNLGQRIGQIVQNGMTQFAGVHNEIQNLAQLTFQQPGTSAPTAPNLSIASNLSGTYTSAFKDASGHAITSTAQAMNVSLSQGALTGNLVISQYPTVSQGVVVGSTSNASGAFSANVDPSGNVTGGLNLTNPQKFLVMVGTLRNGRLSLRLIDPATSGEDQLTLA